MTRPTTPLLHLIGALVLIALPSSLRAQQWNQTLIWERTFVDTSSQLRKTEMALDQRGHIHLMVVGGGNPIVGEPSNGKVTYRQLLPNGDATREVLYAQHDMLYDPCVIRVGGNQSPALALLRGASVDTGASFSLVHIDSTGWPLDTVVTPLSNALGFFDIQYRHSVSVLLDDGFLIATHTGAVAGGSEGMVLRRFDTLGGEVWVDDYSNVSQVSKGPRNGYYVAHQQVDESAMFTSAHLVQLNDSGTHVWDHLVSDEPNTGVLGRVLVGTEDSGAVTVAHRNEVWLQPSQIYPIIMRVSADRSVVWEEPIRHFAERNMTLTSCVGASDGGFLFAGYTSSGRGWDSPSSDSLQQFYLLKLAADGQMMWEWEYGSATSKDMLTGVAFAGDTIVVCGSQDGNLYVAKLKVAVAGVPVPYPTRPASMTVVPNPAAERLVVSAPLGRGGEAALEVVNAVGVPVLRIDLGRQGAGELHREIGLDGMPSGGYRLRLLVDGGLVATGSFIRR